MNLVCCVAYEQNVIEYIFLLNFVMSFASAADHQASSTIAPKQSFVSKKYTQSHFVHMLHNTPDSSNSEELIMFLRQNFIQIGVNETLTKTNENKLIQLK